MKIDAVNEHPRPENCTRGTRVPTKPLYTDKVGTNGKVHMVYLQGKKAKWKFNWRKRSVLV